MRSKYDRYTFINARNGKKVFVFFDVKLALAYIAGMLDLETLCNKIGLIVSDNQTKETGFQYFIN